MTRAVVVHPGPGFSVADVHAGWLSGLADCGVTVQDYNLGERLVFFEGAYMKVKGEERKAFSKDAAVHMALYELQSTCFRFWPDVVFFVSGFFISPDIVKVIRARNMKCVMIHTESPYEDGVQVMRSPAFDLNLINDPTNIDEFRQYAPTMYVPHAYDPDVHHPRDPVPGRESDFYLVGTGYPSRVDFLEAVDWTGIDLKLAGNWQWLTDESPLLPYLADAKDQCIDNLDVQDWYASTKCSANLYRQEAHADNLTDGWAMGPREVELAASETFFLRDGRRTGESDEVLGMLPTFDSPGDFADKLRWWLQHDDQREAVAVKARAAVSNRTFRNHAAEVLQTLEL